MVLPAMPSLWVYYFCSGALGMLCNVKTYRWTIRALLSGGISV